jgi:hypothetical protein
MKLYELAAHYEVLTGMMEAGAAVEDTLEAVNESFEEKVENCMKMYRNLIGQRDMCKAEAYRLNERAGMLEKQAETLKLYVENCMLRAGKEKMKTPLFTVWMQDNPVSLEIVNKDHIPREFWKQPEPTPDNALIKERLKANIPVPGAQLKQTRSLRMR